MSADAAVSEKEELEKLNEEVQRIMGHQTAGRLEQAEEAIERLLAKHEGHPKLLHIKALNKSMGGDTDEAKAMMENVLQHTPEDPSLLNDYGTLLANSGDLERAREQFELAVEVAPNYSLAQSNLGAAMVLAKEYGKAVPHLRKAIELDNNLMDAHTNLAAAYIQTHSFDQAIDILFKALAIGPQSVGAHLQLANALFRRERHESAEHHARRALELAPQSGEGWLHLGNVLAASGKMDEAADAFQKAASRPPVNLAGLGRLINLRKVKPGGPEMKLLETYLGRLDQMQDQGRASVHYSAGKAYDDLGEYDKAFEHLRKGNDLNKIEYPFDAEQHVGRAERLRGFMTPELLERCGGGGVTNKVPIFVCGMPRSGTTLMDQMFSRLSNVQAGGELRAMPMALHNSERIRQVLSEEIPDDEIEADDFTRLGELYVSSLQQEGIKTEYFSDKMPSNYLYIGLIMLAFPRAKILVMRRHPLDCLFSNYMQHFGQNQPFSTDFENMATVYREFDAMAKYWVKLFPDSVREVNYEDVVADQEGKMREILDFVGLDWDESVLDHTKSSRQVNTASVAQVREPIYKTSVAKWRNYGPLLKDLANELRGFLTEEELAACGADKLS